MKNKLFLLFTLLCLSTSALADGVKIDGIYYYLDQENKTAEVTSPDEDGGYSGDITVPMTVVYLEDTYSVTRITHGAFSYCSDLTSVEIPGSVIEIEDGAFRGSISLKSIVIPNSVTKMGEGAFYGCSSLSSVVLSNAITSIEYSTFSGCGSLASIEIPNSVTHIGAGAFRNCGLSSLDIPNSVISIEEGMIEGCNITTIEIPSSVTEIDAGTFRRCGSLQEVNVAADNPEYISVDGVLYNKAQTSILCFPAGKQSTTFTIPNSVTEIGWFAFECNTYLNSVIIPNSVTSIGSAAFWGCSGLTSVDMGNSVLCIGTAAFYNCSSLTSIKIPYSVYSIGRSAFAKCSSLKFVYIYVCMYYGDNILTYSGECPFSSVAEGSILYVPARMKEKYESSSYKDVFSQILTLDDAAGIENADISTDKPSVKAVYGLDGRNVKQGQRGVSIMRYSDGTVRKVFEK